MPSGVRCACLSSAGRIGSAAPLGLPYVNRWDDRIRNYVIGFTELALDTAEMEAHFTELLGAETSARILTRVKRELGL
jgi:hypothetical protein